MTPVLFDVIIVALILISAGLGFMRGLCNEILTIFGWIGAIIATIYFTPVARDYGRTLIENDLLADMATASAIFMITMALFSAISYFATSALRTAGTLTFVDRSLGFGFGILRAVVLLGLTFYLFTFVFSDPENRPDFIKQARTLPFLEASSNWVSILLPEDMGKEIVETGEKTADKASDINESGQKLKQSIKDINAFEEKVTPQDAPVRKENAPTQSEK